MRLRILLAAIILALAALGPSPSLAGHLTLGQIKTFSFTCEGFIKIKGEIKEREVAIWFVNSEDNRYRWDEGNDDGRGDFRWIRDEHRVNFTSGALKRYALKDHPSDGWILRKDSGQRVTECVASAPGEM